MAIRIQCPGCDKTLKARDELAGKRLKCPGCGAAVVVPELVMAAAQPPVPPISSARAEDLPERLPDAKPRRRRGLEGLSPDYRIQLGRWFAASQPHFGKVVGPSIGYFLLFVVIYIVVVLLHFIIIGFLLDPFLIPALAIGMHIVCQRQLKGKPWTFGTFFSGFRFVWPLAARGLLLLLVPVVFALPVLVMSIIMSAAFPGAEQPPLVVGIVAAVMFASACGMIYVGVRLTFFSHWLIIDRQCGAIEALKGSWILSRGHFWGLIGTMLFVLLCVELASLITLGIGALFALPRAVLMLNAGYLMVAGSEPMPGVEPIEPAPPRKIVPAWAFVGAFAAAMILFGVVVGFGSSMAQAEQRERIATSREKDRVRLERSFREQEATAAREREEADRLAKDSVAFFRDGGCWAIEVSEFAGAQASPFADGPQGLPAGRIDGRGMIGGAEPRLVNVVVFGPVGVTKKRPQVKIGVPVLVNSGRTDVVERLERDRMEFSPRWRAFVREFAEAMTRGEVEAAMVPIKPPSGGSGFGGAATGAPPPGGAGIGSAPDEGASARGCPKNCRTAHPCRSTKRNF